MIAEPVYVIVDYHYIYRMKYASPVGFGELGYDPFGMALVGRSWSVGSEYRYGFGGQEDDDEVYGNGNLNTAEFWEYDTRLGKRWNIDPIIKFWESPYAVFGNNPIVISDPSGADGTAEVDQEAQTITITADVYYDASDERFFENGYLPGNGVYWSVEKEEYMPLPGSLSRDEVFNGQSVQITGDDGAVWTLIFKVNYIGLDNQAAVDEIMALNPSANELKIFANPPAISSFASGSYNGSTRLLSAYSGFGAVIEHELGHLFGLEHSSIEADIPENPFFGDTAAECGGLPVSNGYGNLEGPLMSYAANKIVQNYEYKLIVIDTLRLIKGNSQNNITIHIKGAGAANETPEIISTK